VLALGEALGSYGNEVDVLAGGASGLGSLAIRCQLLGEALGSYGIRVRRRSFGLGGLQSRSGPQELVKVSRKVVAVREEFERGLQSRSGPQELIKVRVFGKKR